jgi:hypothetical protein
MMRKDYGLEKPRWHGLEHLEASRKAGHGVLLAPNHTRPSDPFVVAELGVRCRWPVHTMAAWHVFAESRVQGFLLSRIGTFSMNRERTDTASLRCAVDLLANGSFPVVMFPEGILSRTNDHLLDLQRGPAHVARRAARLAAGRGRRVVIHPVFLRYRLEDRIEERCDAVLRDLSTLTGLPDNPALPLRERILHFGKNLLGSKERDITGTEASGPLPERLHRLLEQVIRLGEQHWFGKTLPLRAMDRIRMVRRAVVRALEGGQAGEELRALCHRHIELMYLAQLLYCYPPDYLKDPHGPAFRLLEMVEHFEEDITDNCRPHPPMQVDGYIGEALEVDPLPRLLRKDPLMERLHGSLEEWKLRTREPHPTPS